MSLPLAFTPRALPRLPPPPPTYLQSQPTPWGSFLPSQFQFVAPSLPMRSWILKITSHVFICSDLIFETIPHLCCWEHHRNIHSKSLECLQLSPNLCPRATQDRACESVGLVLVFFSFFFSFPFSVTMVFIWNTLSSFSFLSPHPRPPPHTSFQIWFYVFEYVKLNMLPNGKTELKGTPEEPLPSVSLPSSPHSIPVKDQVHCFLFYPFHALPAHVLFLPAPLFFCTEGSICIILPVLFCTLLFTASNISWKSLPNPLQRSSSAFF